MRISGSVSLRQGPDGRWSGVATLPVGDGGVIRASASTRRRCLASLRRSAERALAGMPDEGRDGTLIELVVESVPLLAGVAEAAEVMGWDKRRVITYIDRGRFPAPIQSLASGRVWIREDVERFAREWSARRAERLAHRRARDGAHGGQGTARTGKPGEETRA